MLQDRERTWRAGARGPKYRSCQVHFSSRNIEWETPQWLFDALHSEFAFTLDPCATRENAKCGTFFTAQEDGLGQEWTGHTVFMNPPYGRGIATWLRKGYESSIRGATVVCLVPARTDTQWWHDYAMRGEVRFLRGRLKFGRAKNSAPFPSAIVVFRSSAFGLWARVRASFRRPFLFRLRRRARNSLSASG